MPAGLSRTQRCEVDRITTSHWPLCRDEEDSIAAVLRAHFRKFRHAEGGGGATASGLLGSGARSGAMSAALDIEEMASSPNPKRRPANHIGSFFRNLGENISSGFTSMAGQRDDALRRARAQQQRALDASIVASITPPNPRPPAMRIVVGRALLRLALRW